MKIKLMLLLIMLMLNVMLNAQNKIPEIINKDLTLKPSAKPYETTGFTLEKGATLTILPGVKVTSSIGKDAKGYCNIYIKGTLIIGAKGPAKSAPVVFDGAAPWFFFTDAKLDINSWDVNSVRYQFFGDNNGTIRNVNFYREQPAIAYTFNLTVPKTGNLTFTDCLIEDQGIDIVTSDFPNDLERLTITKCAFTSKLKEVKLQQHFMPITMFAYATKCDCYVDITFKAFDWPLKKPLYTEWFIGDERAKKTTIDSAKSLKPFALKLGNKPFTTYKQEEAKPEKVEKK